MKVKSMKINSFRGIRDLSLNFKPTQATVIIGSNGVGKSSILDCLAILLSSLTNEFIEQDEEKLTLKQEDINNNRQETKNEITILWENSQEVTWECSLFKTARKNTASNISVNKLIEKIDEKLTASSEQNLPLAIYYRVNRSVLDIPLRIRTKYAFEQSSAYYQALISDKNDFRLFFTWFREREDLENEKRLNENNDYKDPQLEAVRQAITSLMPDFTHLRIKRSPLCMTIIKQGEELIVNQLSDGEKCLLAMAGDLARRLAIANPNLSEPLQGNGVVLIDEIELHLHPQWQRKIIPDLTRTFPNCQFIITTHSPQVLSHVQPERIYILEATSKGIIACSPESSFGRDSNQILANLMLTPERPQEIKDSILELFRVIDQGDLENAKKLRQEIVAKIGEDEPELVKAGVSIRRKEILGH
ncbi:MAG: AAA family ATPase [Gomphosphaeria aponina SAG 52.96 = DSM 107014]|uniref:AAA family ATPase n=1 Tax=Gomphosphaeria aponina SAG 52.96 = DSM 107014 TaxID=1521640 RepID=A0A941JVG0_9CHRO|nr:AAA family ATPase [Gomphosphaeria aponina SAG 52.96 = DSM 107014]